MIDIVERLRQAVYAQRKLGGRGSAIDLEDGERALAEIERLRVENIQMQAALGYGILAEDERHIIPSNPYKCGTCDARRAENERLRVERDEQVQWVKDLADDLIKAEAEIERLRAALKRARDDMEAWGGYASEYFREKHDLNGDLAAIDAVLTDLDGGTDDTR